MNKRIILGTVLAVLSILSAVSLSSHYPTAHASTNPVLGIWNAIRNTNNVTDASLTSGTTFTMDVNITNAGPISAFDITLSYQISGFIVPNPLSVSQDDITFDCSGSQPNNSCLFGRQCNFAVVKRDISYAPYYTIRVAAASNCDVDGNGTLFSVTFHVTNVGVTSFDIIQAGALLTGVKDTLVVAGGTPHPLPNLQVKGAYFENLPNTPTPPVALVTYRPSDPQVGAAIVFNATESYDPGHQSDSDKGIKHVYWNFNDASAQVRGTMVDVSTVTHTFRLTPTQFAGGYFPVSLVVVNANNIPQRAITLVNISTGEKHDLGVSIHAGFTEVRAGDLLQITAFVGNRGNRDERGSLNVTYQFQGTRTVGQEPMFTIPFSGGSKQFQYSLDTTGLTPAVYNVRAVVQILPTNVTDADPTNNVDTVSFRVLPTVVTGGVSPTLLAVGAVVAIAAGIGGLQLLKRRRRIAGEREDKLPE